MTELAIGTEFAGLRLESIAGRGGMGVVYRAKDLRLERTVAVKVIAPELASNDQFRRRFEDESRIAAGLDHPNVLPVYQAGEEDGVLFIVMRFVDGEDLATMIAERGRLELRFAAQIVSQVAGALDEAHAGGLVHRDVKPANVLLRLRQGSAPEAYLTDFGLARPAASSGGLTAVGMVVGTIDYIAPEQLRRHPLLDGRADVYALGGLLYHAITGEVPYPLESDAAKILAHSTEPPPRPTSVVSTLPDALDDVVARALAKSPDDRYPSAGDLGRAFEAAVLGAQRAPKATVVAASAADPEATQVAGASPAAEQTEVGTPVAKSAAPHADGERSQHRPPIWQLLAVLGGLVLALEFPTASSDALAVALFGGVYAALVVAALMSAASRSPAAGQAMALLSAVAFGLCVGPLLLDGDSAFEDWPVVLPLVAGVLAAAAGIGLTTHDPQHRSATWGQASGGRRPALIVTLVGGLTLVGALFLNFIEDVQATPSDAGSLNPVSHTGWETFAAADLAFAMLAALVVVSGVVVLVRGSFRPWPVILVGLTAMGLMAAILVLRKHNASLSPGAWVAIAGTLTIVAGGVWGWLDARRMSLRDG